MSKKIKSILWWALMTGICIYCVWLFFNSIDAYLSQQMNFWSQNLGM